MLRFIICEDNKDFLSKLCNIINKVMMPYNFEYKISKFNSYNEEVEELIERKYEQKIYILDIELGEVSGLEIASTIREQDQDSIIIFITSHNEYKNDIFYSRLVALDYIAKDNFWIDRFESTIEYSIKVLSKKRVLAFQFNSNLYRVPLDNITYIEKVQDNPKCLINTENGDQFEIITSIKNLTNRLGPSFFQTHKSCIINTDKIKSINYSKNEITFHNDEIIYLLSSRKRKELREYVSNR